MNMLNIGRMGLAAVFGVAALAVRAAATMTEVWCSPTGSTTAAYTEKDPGALLSSINKVDTGSAESPSVIHLLPGTYEIAGTQGGLLLDCKKNVIFEGDDKCPGNVVLKGAGIIPQNGTVVTNSIIIRVENTSYARLSGLTFTNFVCSGSIVKFNRLENKPNFVVENCVFAGNFGSGSAVYGGTVKDCSFRGNTNSTSIVSYALVMNSLFEDNASVDGAAVSDGLLYSNTVFRANVATGKGGVLKKTATGNFVVDNCLFESNTAVCGGALWTKNVNADIRNCRFIGNSATDSNGAV